jgi:hypothetical protein
MRRPKLITLVGFVAAAVASHGLPLLNAQQPDQRKKVALLVGINK